MRKKLLTTLLAAAMIITLPGIGSLGAQSPNPTDETLEAQTNDDNDENALFVPVYNGEPFHEIPGRKITFSADGDYSEFAKGLMDDGYEPELSYQWYEVGYDEDDGQVLKSCSCTEKKYEIVAGDEYEMYTCHVTVTLTKGEDVYSQTVTDLNFYVEPDEPFYVYTVADHTSRNGDVIELSGYETTLLAAPYPLIEEEWSDGELISAKPRYNVSDYSYQWEEGYYTKDKETGEEILNWKAIEGETKNTFDITVIGTDRYEGYRCAVTGVIDKGTEKEFSFTGYAEYTIYYFIPMERYITIDKDYYDYDEEVTLTANVEWSEVEEDYHGYDFDLTKNPLTYQWEKCVDEEDDKWEKIDGATDDSLKQTVDGSQIRCVVSGNAAKNEKEYQYSYKIYPVRLQKNMPVNLKINAVCGDDEKTISDSAAKYQYGTNILLKAISGYDEEVSALKTADGQWYVWDEAKNDYAALDGETKESLSVKVEKSGRYQYRASFIATIGEKEKVFAMESSCYIETDIPAPAKEEKQSNANTAVVMNQAELVKPLKDPEPKKISVKDVKLTVTNKGVFKPISLENPASSDKKNQVSYEKPANENAKTIKVPSTVKIDGKLCKVVEINPDAFKNCGNADKIVIGENIKKLENKIFSKCKNLKTVKIESKNIKLGNKLFAGADKLKTVDFTKVKFSVKSVSKKTFTGMKGKVTIKCCSDMSKKKVVSICKKAGASKKVKYKVTKPVSSINTKKVKKK